MAIKPLDDRVVIEVLEAESKTAGGIVLPDSAKEKPQKGKVVAVGPGHVLDSGGHAKLEIKKGDIVLFSKYGGNEVEIKGKDCRIMNETDILAIVE